MKKNSEIKDQAIKEFIGILQKQGGNRVAKFLIENPIDIILQRKEFLESILESIPHPFYVINATNYKVTMANSAANFGSSPETQTCYSLTHNSDKPCSGSNHTCVLEKVKKTTGAKAIGFVGKEKRMVRKAAVCAGSCGKIINQVIAEGCDLYVTGELKHHLALAAQERGLSCMCLSHTVSERFALKNLAKRLKKEIKNVTIRISKKDADPFKWKNV